MSQQDTLSDPAVVVHGHRVQQVAIPTEWPGEVDHFPRCSCGWTGMPSDRTVDASELVCGRDLIERALAAEQERSERYGRRFWAAWTDHQRRVK